MKYVYIALALLMLWPLLRYAGRRLLEIMEDLYGNEPGDLSSVAVQAGPPDEDKMALWEWCVVVPALLWFVLWDWVMDRFSRWVDTALIVLLAYLVAAKHWWLGWWRRIRDSWEYYTGW